MLGLSLLFGCFNEELSQELPLHKVARVQNAWNEVVVLLPVMPEGAGGGMTNNPVQRVRAFTCVAN